MTVHVIRLVPFPGSREPTGTIVWDDVAGEIHGDDEFSEHIRRRVVSAEMEGSTPAHPIPCMVPIIDPLRNAAEMAAILGWDYVLPDWLEDKYPKLPEDESFDDDDDTPIADVIY